MARAQILEFERPLRLVNTSDREWSDSFASQKYRVPAQSEGLAPIDAVRLWFGDPELRDVGDDNARDREYKRLRQRYGAGMGTDDAEWEAQKPRMEVYTLDGERVTTVIDDPTGASLADAPIERDQYEALRGMVANQEKELAEMRRILKDEGNALDAGDDVAEDEPRQVPTGKARASRGAG